jgi:hypothetical protein
MLIRSLSACLLALLLFAACDEDPPQPEALTIEPDEEGVEVPAPPEEIIEGADDLLGRWVILEQAGTAPEDLYYVTFTREGDYIVQNEYGSTERSTFRPAGDNLIAITDSAGTRRYAYEVDGNTLVLGVPGTETRTVLERRN